MEESKKTVLVVEDDDLLRKIVVNQLEGSYNIALAADGAEAWEMVKQQPPNLIVLDLVLPKMDGFELLNKIRSASSPAVSKIPVIVVSNLRNEESIKKARSLGIEEYFVKMDITLKILLNRVDRVFRERAQVV